MKIRWLILILFLILLFPIVSSNSSVDSEIQKLTHYAEEYETGNIDYVQLLLYISSARQNLNEILGASNINEGGTLKQEQIRQALGEPNRDTKWIWIDKENREKKIDGEVPVWENLIIFDGKKIQLTLNAYPSLFSKKDFRLEEEIKMLKEKGEIEEAERLQEEMSKNTGEESLVYRLNIRTEFKRPKDQLDISSKISEVGSLAEKFNSDPSGENAETLAKASVNAERTFEQYFRQNPGKCEDIMKSIFGSENQRPAMKTIVYEIEFYEGENFEAKMRLEMCDDCEWSWIGMNMWLEGRGKFKMPENIKFDETYREKYKSMGSEQFKHEVVNLIEEARKSLEIKDYSTAISYTNRLDTLNQVWNEKSNDVWQEVDKVFEEKRKSMEKQENIENYWWIKLEQEQRKYERELRQKNYEERKQFYIALFEGYEKKEYYYEQIEFSKKLVEEFKEKGEEICDNNQDDNLDEKIDCSDSQCTGKFCGKEKISVTEGNETIEKETDLYCIAKICQAKEEIILNETAVCGNHICEIGESAECSVCESENCSNLLNCVSCQEDCAVCPVYELIKCEGKIIFSGTDENKCPLNPICINETQSCENDEDCADPLCGNASCIEGTCKVKELSECKEAECGDGGEKIQNCASGKEIVFEICSEGIWKTTGIECEVEEKNATIISCEKYCMSQPHIMCVGDWEISGTYPDCVCGWECQQEEIIGNECTIKEDCGGENDVCSNGKCVSLPQVIEEEIIEEQAPEETTEEFKEENKETGGETEQLQKENLPEEESASATGQSILGLFKKITGKITGLITGFQTEESSETNEEIPNKPAEPEQEQDNNGENIIEPGQKEFYEYPQEENIQEEFQEERDDEMREEENEKRCGDECNRICYDQKVRPCVETCVREVCGESFECNVDEETKNCEAKCKEEKDIESCVNDCTPKCAKGGDWWKEFEQQQKEDQFKEQKGAFEVGGGCRTSQGKKESYMWFGGWGDPFEEIQPLKQKYYSGGESEWCKQDFENLKKQRAEFEKGLNEEFVKWFFESYLANSAEDWEQHISGIFELYWKDVDNIMETSRRMQCLGIEEFPKYNLINVKYESEFGSLEFWEELKTVKMPELDDKEMTVVTPYMKIWIFPPKSFIKYELKKSMETGEFPGGPEEKMERKNEEGPTEKEKEFLKQNEKFMESVREISNKYGGNIDAVIQIKDYETNEVVFNLYAQVNENDIIKMKPMLPEQVPEEDVRIEIDFEKIYELIYIQEKEMRGTEIESPPWDKKARGGINKVTSGAKMALKVRGIINSAKIYPEESEKDVRTMFKLFFKMATGGEGKSEDKGNGMDKNSEEEPIKENEILSETGEIIKLYD